MHNAVRLSATLATLLAGATAHSAPISLDTWFQGPRLVDESMSPDAKSLALIVFDGDASYVLVKDRAAGTPPKPVFATDPKQDVKPRTCGWTSNTRIVCRFTGYRGKHGDGEWISRLVAFDSDGGNRRDLLTAGPRFNAVEGTPNSNLNITSWRTDEPDTIALTGWLSASSGYGAARLNVNTGILRVISSRVDYALTVMQDDGAGNVLLGGGVPQTFSRDKYVKVFGRKSNDDSWKLLTRLAPFSNDPRVRLASVIPGTLSAYLVMMNGPRSALYKVDLTDQKDPELVYWHEQRDIDAVLFDRRSRLLGVSFNTSLLGPQYLDPRAASVNEALQKSRPGRWNWIEDVSDDGKVFLIITRSPSEATGSYLLDTRQGAAKFEALGSEWPGLARETLPKTEIIGIKTRSGVIRESLFTAPAGGGKAPLVVFNDGAQSTGGFEPATYFLVSRGYAVLRPYFAGGEAQSRWPKLPYLDWNGVLYDELVDAVGWAQQRPEVDGTRVCIVGRGSYGGYQAMLAAARADSPFKCAASIGSDLSDLDKPRKDVERASLIEDERPVGTSDEQVAKESPLRRAAEFRMPMLFVVDDTRTHSARDNEGGREMAAALAKAKKPQQLVLVDDIDEPYTRQAYDALEKFLAANLR